MPQVGQAREYPVRHSVGSNTVRTKLASRRNKQQSAPFARSVLAEQNDAVFVAAAQSGFSEAFEVLVRRHQARILSVTWRFTRNREDAEDVTQQTFQRAFEHLRRFRGNSSFATWLTRIAINEALMWSRRKRHFHVSLEMLNVNGENTSQLDPADLAPNPEETCLQLERQRILSAAVNSLRPKLRRVMELRDLTELSIEETAAFMGVSVGTVKARLFRGRTKLRGILKPHIRPNQAFARNRRPIGVASEQLVFACK